MLVKTRKVVVSLFFLCHFYSKVYGIPTQRLYIRGIQQLGEVGRGPQYPLVFSPFLDVSWTLACKVILILYPKRKFQTMVVIQFNVIVVETCLCIFNPNVGKSTTASCMEANKHETLIIENSQQTTIIWQYSIIFNDDVHVIRSKH